MSNIRLIYSVNQVFIQKHSLTKNIAKYYYSIFPKIHVKIENIKFITKTMINIKTQYLGQKLQNILLQNVINNKFFISFKSKPINQAITIINNNYQ